MPLFEELVGATILRIGTPVDLDLEGGGLAIEYCHGDGEAKLALFGFSEMGMWSEGND